MYLRTIRSRIPEEHKEVSAKMDELIYQFVRQGVDVTVLQRENMRANDPIFKTIYNNLKNVIEKMCKNG